MSRANTLVFVLVGICAVIVSGSPQLSSIRYSGAEGPITITAEVRGEEIAITISDNGPGVPEASIPRLSDAFYRPDEARTWDTGGAGLGLAILKTCVEATQGSVTVRTRRIESLLHCVPKFAVSFATRLPAEFVDACIPKDGVELDCEITDGCWEIVVKVGGFFPVPLAHPENPLSAVPHRAEVFLREEWQSMSGYGLGDLLQLLGGHLQRRTFPSCVPSSSTKRGLSILRNRNRLQSNHSAAAPEIELERLRDIERHWPGGIGNLASGDERAIREQAKSNQCEQTPRNRVSADGR